MIRWHICSYDVLWLFTTQHKSNIPAWKWHFQIIKEVNFMLQLYVWFGFSFLFLSRHIAVFMLCTKKHSAEVRKTLCCCIKRILACVSWSRMAGRAHYDLYEGNWRMHPVAKSQHHLTYLTKPSSSPHCVERTGSKLSKSSHRRSGMPVDPSCLDGD